jgi:putative nucleotidyltransferase with HDIG domain
MGTFFEQTMNSAKGMLVYPAAFQGIQGTRHTVVSSNLASLGIALGLQDAYTRGHASRVAVYAERIAERIGLARENVETIRIAGLFHDIGKIAFSPRLLSNTEGRLSAAMRTEIRKHPEFGVLFLKAFHVADTVIDGVRYHHERLDGSGYPYGLKAAEIPLSAKIISVADCFDALTTDRSYQKGRQPAQALIVMEQLAEGILSPELVRVLVEDIRINGILAN